MNNYVNDGNTISYTNAGASSIASGTVVVAKNTLGVAMADISPGATGTLCITGQVTAAKATTAVFGVGEKLLFDVSAAAFDDSAATAATGDVTGAAVAAAAGASGETTCRVILTPGNTAIG